MCRAIVLLINLLFVTFPLPSPSSPSSVIPTGPLRGNPRHFKIVTILGTSLLSLLFCCEIGNRTLVIALLLKAREEEDKNKRIRECFTYHMTRLTIFITTSFKVSKKAFNGVPFSPIRPSTIPNTIENTTKPRTFIPPSAPIC